MKKLALLLLLALPLLGQTKFDRAKFEIRHEKFVLDNGLTVLVHEDHSVPVVGVNVWYHVGSRNEKRGKTGFAHLFEHFFFNGSEHYPHGFREAMDDLGANGRNGTTNSDRTNFFEDVPVSALERTLYLEADRMGFLAANISKEMLERERGVVQNEKRQGENQPYGRVFERVAETIYPYSHPYSWTTIGSMEDLNAATLNDVKEWYATYYGPNNAVLALAGDITVARAKELVTKYFNGIPPGPALARAEQWIPKLDRNIRDTMQDRVPQTRIYRVWHGPAWSDARIQHLELAAEILSGSKSARLDRRLVYEKELVTNVGAFVDDSEIAGAFYIQATVKPGVDPAVVEKEIDAIVADLIEKGPTAAELQRAQSRSLAEFVRGMETLGGFGGRSEILAESQTYGGRGDAYLDRLEKTAKATPTDVQKVAKTWLDANHYTLHVNPMPQLAAGKTDVDRKILPALGDAPEVTFPAVQRATLSNGLKVILLERHSTPIVNVALAADAGFASDPAAKAGLAALTLDVIDEGTTTRDTFKIVDELDALGARIGAFNTLDLSVLSLQALPMHLGASLDLLADVARNPAFPQELVDLSIRQRVARIRQEQAQPNASAMRILPRLLYGESHAYAKPFTGSGYVPTVSALKRADLTEWHRTWFVPNNATVIVTGDVTLKQLVPELERAFGAWKPGETPKKNLATVPRTAGKKVYLIDKPDAPQSLLVAAHLSETGGQADELAIESVLRNFGGISTSRLMRNLRLDKHWTYGVRGGLNDARGQRPFVITTAVQTDKTKESIQELIKEMRGVAGERPIAGEEFASAMRNQTLGLPGRFDTLSALENAALSLVNYGYPDDYYAKYASSVRALTADQLNAAGKRIVHPEEVIWIVVGDLKKVEAGIRELGLGEVVRYTGEM
ncbi:MAG TPA: pitrilysin family protein [Thermoanaerobaculia bacterium]